MSLIIGGGKYGVYAIEFLKKHGSNFIVVDKNPNCLAVKRFQLRSTPNAVLDGDAFVEGDLLSVLELIQILKPEYIFPTAPVHVAADLVTLRYNLMPWPEAIDTILTRLPPFTVLKAEKGKLVASFNRGYQCVEKCSMPKVCPSSGISKPCTMTELFRFACPEAFILVSYSMAPGMGALRGEEVLSFLESVKSKDKFAVATVCDCHGVLDCFMKTNKP